MSALLAPILTAEAAEQHRRGLLAEADELLDQVERLRLDEARDVPRPLADAIRSLHLRLGRTDAARPRTVRAAHQLLFAAQGRLMAANPRNPRPRGHVGRPEGTARITPLRRGGAWKVLALPPLPPARSQAAAIAEWRLLAWLTVERAFDRWASAQEQAVVAARSGEEAVTAVGRARAAWANYWELLSEAEDLVSRLGTPPPRSSARQPRIESSRCSRSSSETCSGSRLPTSSGGAA
jgi:hypothetical protein